MNFSLSLASGLDDAFAAAPLLILAVFALAALAAVSFAKRKAAAAYALCAIGLAAALASSIALSLPMLPRQVGSLLSMDGLSFLGIALDARANADPQLDAEVGAAGAATRTFVIESREDLQIARDVRRVLGTTQ